MNSSENYRTSESSCIPYVIDEVAIRKEKVEERRLPCVRCPNQWRRKSDEGGNALDAGKTCRASPVESRSFVNLHVVFSLQLGDQLSVVGAKSVNYCLLLCLNNIVLHYNNSHWRLWKNTKSNNVRITDYHWNDLSISYADNWSVHEGGADPDRNFGKWGISGKLKII